MGMDGQKLWETIRPALRYPHQQKNVTATTVGLKHAMDVNVLNPAGPAGPTQTEIVSGASSPADVSLVAGIWSLAVRVTDLVLSHVTDSISIGANGTVVSDAAPFPVKLVPAPSTVTLNATSSIKTANYTEAVNALHITVICDLGSCILPGGRSLSAGESITFSAPNGYQLSAFTVTFVSGQFTINVLR